MRQIVLGFVFGVMAAGVAVADPITGEAARAMLYPAGDAQVQIIKGTPLSETEAKLIAQVVVGQPYFGAIAISPDEKLLESKATIAVANFHSTEAAMAEATRQCDALRAGKRPCVVAAVIRPKNWAEGALSLSSEATAGFVKSYPATAGAMAASATTGAWGIASGQGAGDAAIKACAAKASDCKLVVVN